MAFWTLCPHTKTPITRTTFATDNQHIDGTAELLFYIKPETIGLLISVDLRVEVVGLRVWDGN
jgi:hypothetical protein